MNALFLRRSAAASGTFATVASRRAFSQSPARALARMNIIGRLGAEPEVVSVGNEGREIVRYVLGTSTGTRENPQTSWFTVASFDEGPRKDFLLGLPKGTLMHLEADAKMRVFETNEGQKTSRLSLTQRNIEVLSRPARQESSTPDQ